MLASSAPPDDKYEHQLRNRLRDLERQQVQITRQLNDYDSDDDTPDHLCLNALRDAQEQVRKEIDTQAARLLTWQSIRDGKLTALNEDGDAFVDIKEDEMDQTHSNENRPRMTIMDRNGHARLSENDLASIMKVLDEAEEEESHGVDETPKIFSRRFHQDHGMEYEMENDDESDDERCVMTPTMQSDDDGDDGVHDAHETQNDAPSEDPLANSFSSMSTSASQSIIQPHSTQQQSDQQPSLKSILKQQSAAVPSTTSSKTQFSKILKGIVEHDTSDIQTPRTSFESCFPLNEEYTHEQRESDIALFKDVTGLSSFSYSDEDDEDQLEADLMRKELNMAYTQHRHRLLQRKLRMAFESGHDVDEMMYEQQMEEENAVKKEMEMLRESMGNVRVGEGQDDMEVAKKKSGKTVSFSADTKSGDREEEKEEEESEQVPKMSRFRRRLLGLVE